jgi:hypothetical protein
MGGDRHRRQRLLAHPSAVCASASSRPKKSSNFTIFSNSAALFVSYRHRFHLRDFIKFEPGNFSLPMQSVSNQTETKWPRVTRLLGEGQKALEICQETLAPINEENRLSLGSLGFAKNAVQKMATVFKGVHGIADPGYALRQVIDMVKVVWGEVTVHRFEGR